MLLSADKEIGSYQLGLFHSRSSSGVPYELINVPSGVGRDDIPRTVRQITLIHESVHYLHDLALGTCIDADFLHCEKVEGTYRAAAYLHSLGQSVLCPLQSHDPGQAHGLDAAATRHHVLESLLGKVEMFDTRTLPDFPDQIELSSIHLLEGIAAVRTWLALSGQARDEKDLKYLRAIRDDIPLLPSNLPQEYTLALRLFDATVGRGFLEKPGGKRDWPTNSLTDSWRRFVDLAFIHIAELALHIPPRDVILMKSQSGSHPVDAFIPIQRFARMIVELCKYGGFPDKIAEDTNQYHAELYDWFASRLGWVSYLDTQGAWESLLVYRRDKSHRGFSDGFRCRMLAERSRRSLSLLYDNPLVVLAGQKVPKFHVTPLGIKMLRAELIDGAFWGSPFEFNSLADPWQLVQSKPKYWRNSPKESIDPIQDEEGWTAAMLYEMDRWMSFGREIAVKMTRQALGDAMYEQECFVCPWHNGGCDVAESRCAKIRDLHLLPTGKCAVRYYLAQVGLEDATIEWK